MLMSFASHCSVPTQPSRVGNSLCRDTTPDLTYCRYLRDAHWSSTHQSLASDHYVLTMQVCTSPRKPRPHVIRHTDWDAFRARRQHSATPDIEDLSQWTDQLLANLNGVTASIPTTANHLVIAFCLTHLQATHTSLTNRWNKQRHNHRLHRRIAALDREIETHTTTLAQQQWEQLCSRLSSLLGCKQLWHLLCPLLDPTSAKSALAILVLRSLPKKLNSIPGLKHTLLYEDDMTFWVTSGSDGHVRYIFQRATNVVTDRVHVVDLTCSAGKSALLLIRPPDRRRLKKPHPTIVVHSNSNPVPVV
ncbi:hypothetical protein HPB52_010997 [Rhipicephalus sanguineus]|uniref:Tick transposon n=1 Tax=Rhipicephalus sanguineus TaxID=34632 RepID=A0A9D4PN34_RHISA|nr:hypothetical protein HPB52_010997 [Rhipicephalus sanguineus]